MPAGHGRGCSAYWDLCSRLEPARRLYRVLAAPRMEHPYWREAEAALSASARAGLIPGRCQAIEYLSRLYRESRACVLGPLPVKPGSCQGMMTIATEAALAAGSAEAIEARLVVGDLDSRIAGLAGALAGPRRILLAHIHGDNYLRAAAEPLLRSPWVVPTSQTACAPPVLGTGAYTDGDRAIVLLMALGASEILLAGFDFSRPSCIHKSGSYCSAVKAEKLRLARRIILRASRLYGYRVERRAGVMVLRRV